LIGTNNAITRRVALLGRARGPQAAAAAAPRCRCRVPRAVAAAAAMSGSDELQSFLALAKGARGRAAAAVVADATAAPGLFAFGELLDTPGVKEVRGAPAHREMMKPCPNNEGSLVCVCVALRAQLAGTEFAPALELLRLFAFGTLSDYKGTPGAHSVSKHSFVACRRRVFSGAR
jgi:hypothetical protein